MAMWYMARTSSTGIDATCVRQEFSTVEEALKEISGSPYAAIEEFEDGWLLRSDFYYPRYPDGIAKFWPSTRRVGQP